MTIYYWTSFSKRKNSTKQPSGGTSLTVRLKEGTSIENPTFLITGDKFDIVYVKAFSDHYYFVTDIKSVKNGLTEISCKMDALATFKSTIGSYTAFIERCDYYNNPMIPDPLVAVYNDENTYFSSTAGSYFFSTTGIFVLCCINNKGSEVGYCSYYVLSASTLQSVANYCSNSWDSASTDLIDWIQSTFLKTFESIVDCIWLPVDMSKVTGTSTEHIYIGVDDIQIDGKRITGSTVILGSASLAIPGSYTDFRKGPPYTTGRLFIPMYGMIDFNPLEFDGGDVNCVIYSDVATGDTVCYIKTDLGRIISTITYNIAVQCPIGKVGANATGTIGGILSTAGNVVAAAATHGATSLGAGLAASASAVNTIANAVAPTVSVKGGKGGRALSRNTDFSITIIEKVTNDPAELRTTHGQIWMREGQISSTNGGYVQCSNASVPISGMEAERDEINNFLNSGFYYE